MTLVQIRAKSPSTEGLADAKGSMLWQPTARRIDSGEPGEPSAVVPPSEFTVQLVGGSADIEVEPSTLAWVWSVAEYFHGTPVQRRAVIVPAIGPVSYADLVEVDPATLDPVAVPEAAWWAALDQAQLGVQAIVDPDDPDALILHYPSWQADPADDLILIMPIQEA